MVQKAAPAPRGRVRTERMVLRRRRIFARLREGWSYGEIAAEEGVTITWVRQIVADVLEKRAVDSGAEHAKLQLERLAPAMQLAADAISAKLEMQPLENSAKSQTNTRPALVSALIPCRGCPSGSDF